MKLMTLAFALSCLPFPAAAQDPKNPDKIVITAEFENASLEDVLGGLKELSGVPIEIDDAARKKTDFKAATTFKVKDVTLTTAVKLLVGPHGLEVKSVHDKKLVITVPKS